MDRRRAGTVTAGVLAALVVGLAAGWALGFVPFFQEAEPPPEKPSGNESLPVNVTFTNETSCGFDCRIVNMTLRNEGDEPLTNVTVEWEIFAGGEAPIWNDTGDAGQLGPGDAVDFTRRVEVGSSGAQQVIANDGEIVTYTTVRTNAGNRTFERTDGIV